MKKNCLLSFLVMGISQLAFTQVKNPENDALNHIFLQNLNGNVKKAVIEYKFNGNSDKNEEFIFEKGLLTERIVKYSNGKQSLTKIEYDKNNKINSIIGFNPDNKRISTISYKYNKNGNLIEYKYEYSGSGTAVEKYAWENNKVKEIKNYEKTSKLIRTDTYDYLPTGKINQISQLYYYENAPSIVKYNHINDKQYSFQNTYHLEEITIDENGFIREKKRTSNNGKRTDISKFNEQGWILEVNTSSDGNNDNTKYVYSFDNKNNVNKLVIFINDKIENEWNISYEYY